jgi:uncharacterized protein YoxC
MKKLATLLVIAIAFAVIGCQPPQGGNVVTTDQLDAAKTEISALKTQVETLQTAVDSLTAQYNAHIEKFHKSGTKVPVGGKTPVKPPITK